MKLVETLTLQALGLVPSLQSPDCRVILHTFKTSDPARWGRVPEFLVP
jgi:hypothetical protein